MSVWPRWMGQWYGVVLRAVLALGGAYLGYRLVYGAFFSATFVKSPAVWGFEPISLLTMGVVIAGSSVFAAMRPGKLTLLIPVVAVIVLRILVSFF